MDPKIHHYVPQWYLKNFASNKDRIRVIDRERSTTYVTNVANAAAESGYYGITTPDGSSSAEMEHALGQIESRANKAVRKLLRRGFPVSEPERLSICTFVAAQYLRGPKRRDAFNMMTDQLFKAQAAGMSKAAIAEALRDRTGTEPTEEEVDQQVAFLRDSEGYTVSDKNAAISALALGLDELGYSGVRRGTFHRYVHKDVMSYMFDDQSLHPLAASGVPSPTEVDLPDPSS